MHVFLDCKRARDFWDDFRLSTGMDIDINWFSIKYLVFEDTEDADSAAALVTIGLHALWKFRTAIQECQEAPQTPWESFKVKVAWVRSALGARSEWTNCDTLRAIVERIKTPVQTRSPRHQFSRKQSPMLSGSFFT